MLRRISTKLVLAVLTAVVLPFVAFSVFIDDQMANRLTRHVVQQSLLGLVKDLAGQIDYFVDEREQDLLQWAGAPLTAEALDDYTVEHRLLERGGADGEGSLGGPPWDAEALLRVARGEATVGTFNRNYPHRAQLTRELDRYVELKRVYDLLLLVSADGRLVTCSSQRPEGGVLDPEFIDFLFGYDYRREPWLERALSTGEIAQVDQHVSPFRLAVFDESQDLAWNYHIGFAAPIDGRGVLYALVNWWFVQDIVNNEILKDAFRGLVEEGEDPSPYAWIWAADADTILGHPDRRIYYKSISRDLGLEQMTRAVLADSDGWGLYPEYEFQGNEKNAAFKRCAPPEAGGFDWVVGVGINNEDIYATADELRALLLGGTALVLLMATLWTLVIARRATRPILELQRYTRRVAHGELDAQIEIRSKDELGELAHDFNVMTRELATQRAQLVKAEKDAAWREMARQIAHDIKNPLTPIKLSLDLLERARRERSPGSEEILERTMGLIGRQVENLRRIAGDFYEFTGGQRARHEEVDVGALVDEVLHLHDAWAVELGVTMQREGPSAIVLADLGKLRRVLVNLVSNALQAMPEGGSLFVESALEDGWIRISIRDTGVGLSSDVREHLFEPYFTTKSEGTGLGLAISRRVIEELGGEIDLAPADGGPGTVATVRLSVLRRVSPGEGDAGA